MAVSGARNVGGDPISLLAEQFKSLQRQLEDLRSAPFSIPLMDTDPDPSTGINMWAFRDGRLRIRVPTNSTLPRTYTILEWAKVTTPGGSTSGSSLPTVPSMAVSRIATYVASWSESFNEDGTLITSPANTLLVGQDPNTFGNIKRSLIGFDASTIISDLSGSTINRVTLTLQPLTIPTNYGSSVFLSETGDISPPASWDGTTLGDIGGVSNYILTSVTPITFDIGVNFAAFIRDSTSSAISLIAPSSNLAYYGVIAGVGLDGYTPPTLTVEYFK